MGGVERGGALSSLPVDNLTGAAGEGLGAHRGLALCLGGDAQQLPASALGGKDVVLGAALKDTERKR